MLPLTTLIIYLFVIFKKKDILLIEYYINTRKTKINTKNKVSEILNKTAKSSRIKRAQKMNNR